MTALSLAGESPTQESLIEAWEQNLRGSPDTILLETTGEPLVYQYQTEMFNYEGELRVLDVYIEEFMVDMAPLAALREPSEGESAFTYMGTLTLELPQLKEELKTNTRYYNWLGENASFYYNQTTQEWMSQKNYFSQMETCWENAYLWTSIFGLILLGALALLIVAIPVAIIVLALNLGRIRKETSQRNQRLDHLLTVQEETLKELRQVMLAQGEMIQKIEEKLDNH